MCLECGHLYEWLANHLRLLGLTGAAYREKWGYSRGTALITPAVHERLSQLAFDRNLPALSPPDAIHKALAAKQGRSTDIRMEGRGSNRAASSPVGGRVAPEPAN